MPKGKFQGGIKKKQKTFYRCQTQRQGHAVFPADSLQQTATEAYWDGFCFLVKSTASQERSCLKALVYDQSDWGHIRNGCLQSGGRGRAGSSPLDAWSNLKHDLGVRTCRLTATC